MAQHQDLCVLGHGVHAVDGQCLYDLTDETVEEAERHGPAGSPLGSWLVKPAIALSDPSGQELSGLRRRLGAGR